MSADWLVSALTAHKRGDHAGALGACLQAPRDGPSQTRAHAIRAATFSKLDRPEEALSEIESALRLGADSIELYKLAARICVARGDRRAARDWIDRALQQHPSSRELLELREHIVMRMHLLTGLYDHVELAVRLHPTWTAVRERLISCLFMLRLYEAAEVHLGVMIAQEGHRAELWVQQAIIAIETGRCTAAVPALDRALALSESPTERALIAQLFLRAGALTKARQTVEQNLVRAAAASEALLQAGFFALWQGDLHGAEHIVRQLGSQTAGRARLEAGIALVGGRYDAGLVAAAEALHENGTDAEAHALRAACLFFLARHDEARHAASTAAQNTIDWLPAADLVRFGAQAATNTSVNHSDYVDVLEWLGQLVPELALAPSGRKPLPSRPAIEAATAGIRRLSGNFTSALTFLTEPSRTWTSLTPRLPARVACARTADAIQARPWEWVVERIGALAAVYPGAPYVHTYAAELWLWCGEYARCEAECRKALALGKMHGSRWAWVGLGASLMFREQYVDALDVFAESNRLMQPGGPLLAFRGEALRRCGELAAARNDLTRALELGPARVSAWLNLGLVSLADGREDEARAIAAAFQARLAGFVDDIRRDMGMAAPEVGDSPREIANLFEHALAVMRGNRSSGRITYFLSDGEARIVNACTLTPAGWRSTAA